MDKQKLSDGLDKVSLLARLLGLLERLLPAFLVAWNNQLRQDNKQLALKLEKSGIKAEVLAKKEEVENASKDPTEVINKFLKS